MSSLLCFEEDFFYSTPSLVGMPIPVPHSILPPSETDTTASARLLDVFPGMLFLEGSERYCILLELWCRELLVGPNRDHHIHLKKKKKKGPYTRNEGENNTERSWTERWEWERANNITGTSGSSPTCRPSSPVFLQMSQYAPPHKFNFVVVRTFNIRSTFLRNFKWTIQYCWL